MILCPSLFFSASLRSFPPDERRLSLATHPQDTRRFVTSKLDGRSSAQNARGRRPEVTAAILTDEPLLRDESAFIGRKKKLWGGTPLPHRLFGAGESLPGESLRGESLRGENLRGENLRGESVRWIRVFRVEKGLV
jgi:hypothetical protein